MPTITKAIDGPARLRERVDLLDAKKLGLFLPVKDVRETLDQLDAAKTEIARLKAELDQRLLFEKPKNGGDGA